MRHPLLRQRLRCLTPDGWGASTRRQPPCRAKGTGKDCQLRMTQPVTLCSVLIHGVTHLRNQRRLLLSGRQCHSSLQCPLVILFRGIRPQVWWCLIRRPDKQRSHRKRFLRLLRRPNRQCAHRKRFVHLLRVTVRDPRLHPKGEGHGSLIVSVHICSSRRFQLGLALFRLLLMTHRPQSCRIGCGWFLTFHRHLRHPREGVCRVAWIRYRRHLPQELPSCLRLLQRSLQAPLGQLRVLGGQVVP